MNGGLLPGSVTLVQTDRYIFIQFDMYTGMPWRNTYSLFKYDMQFDLNLN